MSEIIEAKWSDDQDITAIFAELGDECKIGIHRKEPEWCGGHIRTVTFDPKEPISIDWIAAKFGGEKLMVRLYGPKTKQNKSGYLAARTIEIMGPPRDGYGIEMVQGPDGKAVKVTELDLVMERHRKQLGIQKEESPRPTNNENNGLSQTSLVQTLIESQSQQHNAMLQMMGQRVQSLEQMLYHHPPGQAPAAMSPIEQIKQTAEAIALLDKMKGSFSGGGEGMDDSLFSMIGPVVQNLFGQNQQNQGLQVPRGSLQPPKSRRVRSMPARRTRHSPEQQTSEPGLPEQQTSEPSTPATIAGVANDQDTLPDIADRLSRLNPDDAAEVVVVAMGNMPDERRAAAMQSFFHLMNSMDNVDESSNQDDTYIHEDNPDPFAATTEDQPVSIQGIALGSNENHVETDREGDQDGIPTSPNP
jgi:hypothetical protein